MASVDDLDGVLERFKQAGNEFVKGNPKPVQKMFSHREDVSLANPFGPPARGWERVAEAQERGASVFRDGEIYAFEIVARYVTPDLACILWIERTKAKVGGAQEEEGERHEHEQAGAPPTDPRMGSIGATLRVA